MPRLFVPWARMLLDELALDAGEEVLDVACGPGSVTRLAAEAVGPTGRVTGCDFSPAMLELALAKPAPSSAAAIEYLEASADALPVASESFDVALCQQGLQFFPDRLAALAELRRALRPGGRVGIAVWADIHDSPVFGAMYDAIRETVDVELADRVSRGALGLSESERTGGAARRRGLRRDQGRATHDERCVRRGCGAVRRHTRRIRYRRGKSRPLNPRHRRSSPTPLSRRPRHSRSRARSIRRVSRTSASRGANRDANDDAGLAPPGRMNAWLAARAFLMRPHGAQSGTRVAAAASGHAVALRGCAGSEGIRSSGARSTTSPVRSPLETLSPGVREKVNLPPSSGDCDMGPAFGET